MPYIKQEDRRKLDNLVDRLIEVVGKEPIENQDGVLNYVITRMIKKTYPLRYKDINRAMGMLECVKQEFYRRVAGPYENLKIRENGDVK